MTAETRNSTRKFVRHVFIAIAAVCFVLLGLTLLYYAFDILLLVFAAILLAIFLHGLADIAGRWIPLSQTWRVLLVSVVLLLIIAGAVTMLAPSVADQATELRAEVPRSAQKTSEFLSQYAWGRTLMNQLPSADDVVNKIDIGSMLTRVGGFFSSTIGAVGNLFITILLAIYFACEPAFYSGGMTRFFPIPVRRRAGEILSATYETLRWWLIGKAISMLFIGLVTWIGLSIMGVPLALTLGLIAGLLSFIPNFGPILSAVPAILLAFIHSPISAVYVAGLFVGVQVVESNVVTPYIERKTVELAPALTIVFQLVLGVLIGGLGLVLATPLLAVIVVLVKMIYFEDVLGDKEDLDAKVEVEAKENNRQDEQVDETDA